MRNLRLNIVAAVVGVFIVAVSLPWAAATPVHLENERLVSIALMKEESNPDARVRREADSNLPDQLTFQVPMHNGDVTLRMKRSRLLPTVTSQSPLATPFSENAAVYTDAEQGASMIVKREAGEYNLQGSFTHAEEEWSLEPLARSRREASGSGSETHRVFPGFAKRETVSFVGDEIVDTEPPVEILSLADRNRHRMERLKAQQQQEAGSGSGNGQQQGMMGGNRRSKRDAVEHIVELVFVVDYADYEKWVTLKGQSNAINEMTLWYTYVAESINIRYRTIVDPDIIMGTVTTFLKILTTESDDDFIEDLLFSGVFDGGAGLNAFRTWYQDPSNGIPNADHYMYFTGFDINGASGIAFGSRVCTSAGVSITENSFTAGVGGVAAHELGHSLSANHDSQTGSCSDTTQHIMSAILSLPVRSANTGNPWKFSSCSIDAFKTYLSGFTCTEPQNTGTTDALPAPTGNNRAGIVEDRDDQCRQYFRDSSSSYCSIVQRQNGGESSLCGGMYCAIPGSPNSCRTMLPLEFTTCGTGQWCRLGFCVAAVDDTTQAPSTQAPSTQAPSTQAPSTQAPSTQAPSTQAPSTQAPSTQAPSTQAPSTQAPSTQAPSTQAPSTQAPSTQAPSTQAPSTQAPSTQAPSTQAPSTQAPSTQAPSTQAPSTQAPSTQAPSTQAPSTQAPSTQAPSTQAPSTEAPSTQEPFTEAPSTQEPFTEAPSTQEPSTEAPSTQDPYTEAPTTTTTEEPTGPTSIFDCFPYIRNGDFRGFWDCYREVWAYLRSQRRRGNGRGGNGNGRGNNQRGGRNNNNDRDDFGPNKPRRG